MGSSTSTRWNGHQKAPVVEDCLFFLNEAWEGGGLAMVLRDGIVRGCTFRNNRAMFRGGAAFLDGGLVERCTFESNDTQV